MELLHENGCLEDNIEFDFETSEFLEVMYTTLELEPLSFRKKSTNFPQLQNFPCLSAFTQKVSAEIEDLDVRVCDSSNLTQQQSKALQELLEEESLVIKPSDKGGNIEIRSRDLHMSICVWKCLITVNGTQSPNLEYLICL